MSTEIKIYTTPICAYCVRAKSILARNGLAFTEIDVSDPAERQKLVAKSGRKTVPQIYIGEHHVGGSDELLAIEASGELLALVRTTPPA